MPQDEVNVQVDDKDIIKKPEDNLLESYNKLKESTVSKEDYNKLMELNKNLVDTLSKGGGSNKEEQLEVLRTSEECRQVFKKELNNLEFCQAALDLREAVMREKNIDIFVGRSHNLTPTQEAYDSAQRVADVMKDCIDRANGDSEYFTNELMRKTNDVALPFKRK